MIVATQQSQYMKASIWRHQNPTQQVPGANAIAKGTDAFNNAIELISIKLGLLLFAYCPPSD